MIPYLLPEITAADIHALIREGERESLTLDYKEEIFPVGNDGEKLLADVVAFANADGGDLVFGMSEGVGDQNGLPEKVVGLAIKNESPDELLRRIQHKIEKIVPRVAGIGYRMVDGFGHGRPVLVVRVPRSFAKPHCYFAGGGTASPKFLVRRASAMNASMDYSELRAAFLHSEQLIERIRQLRADRVRQIYARETAMPLGEETLPVLVLHIIPVGHFDRFDFDVHKVDSAQNFPMPITPSIGGTLTYNFDGWISFDRLGDEVHQYVQYFRNGVIEAASGGMGTDVMVFGRYLANEVPGTFRQYMNHQVRMGIDGPWLIGVSLAGIKGRRLNTNEAPHLHHRQVPAQLDVMRFPEQMLESWKDADDPHEAMMPTLNAIWQAFGYRAFTMQH